MHRLGVWYAGLVYHDVERRLNELAASQHGLVTRRQARAAGASASAIDRLIDRGSWMPAFDGVYQVASSPKTHIQRVLAAVLSVGPEAVASHQTAAQIWELLGTDNGPVHVTTSRPRWRSRAFVVHRSTDLAPVHTTIRDGVPITNVPRTIVDLGATASKWSVEKAVDTALRGQLVRLEEVWSLIDQVARQGRRGVKVAREVVAARLQWANVTESALEDEFQRLLRESDLPLPVSQHVVADAGSSSLRVDFAYPKAHVAIELDGYRYHSDPAAFVQDRERQNRLISAGYRVLRYTVRDLRDRPEAVISEISELLKFPVNNDPA